MNMFLLILIDADSISRLLTLVGASKKEMIGGRTNQWSNRWAKDKVISFYGLLIW